MSEEMKEIDSCLLACAEGLGVPLPTREREALTRRLLPLTGADLFRILWSIPERFKGKPFPSGEAIERLVRQHMSGKPAPAGAISNRLKSPPPATANAQALADHYGGEIIAKLRGRQEIEEIERAANAAYKQLVDSLNDDWSCERSLDDLGSFD